MPSVSVLCNHVSYVNGFRLLEQSINEPSEMERAGFREYIDIRYI